MVRKWKHGWIPLNAEARAYAAAKERNARSDAGVVADAEARIAARRRESGYSPRGSGDALPKPQQPDGTGQKMYVADFVGGVPVMGTVRVPPGAKVIKKPRLFGRKKFEEAAKREADRQWYEQHKRQVIAAENAKRRAKSPNDSFYIRDYVNGVPVYGMYKRN